MQIKITEGKYLKKRTFHKVIVLFLVSLATVLNKNLGVCLLSAVRALRWKYINK